MVDHIVHETVYHELEVRGHVAVYRYNESARCDSMGCRTCGWCGPVYGPRHRKDVADTWREHAADVVMGENLSHGRPEYACRCWECDVARREAAQALKTAESAPETQAAKEN